METAPITSDDARPRRRGRPPQQGLAEQRRRQIVESAYRVFAEQGYESSTIAAVAKHAGVGQGTVYRYFDSKRELLDHVVDFGFERLVTATGMDEALSPPADAEEFAALVRELAERLFALVDDEPELLKLILVEATAIDDELQARLFGLGDLVASMLAGVLDVGQRAGWVRPELDARAAAHGLQMLVVPGLLLVLRGQATPANRARYVAGLTGFVLHGIGAR